MNPELQALARQIADAGIPWKQPGAACRDPDSGLLWRMLGNDRVDCVREFASFENECESMDLAIANGPNLDDNATLGVLLGLMPGHSLVCGRRTGHDVWGWVCAEVAPPIDKWHRTRAEAIARAALAAHGIEAPHAD